MNYSDETLMAFADGELDAALSAEIDDAQRVDAGLARRIAAHRQLRHTLQRAYAAELDEPVPERLLATLAPKAPRSPSRTAPYVLAMAASVLVGIATGYVLWQGFNRGPVSTRHGVLVADAALSQTLSQTLASETEPHARIRIGVSYRSKSGDLCRSFSDAALAGIACRHGEQWRVRLLTQTNDASSASSTATGGYRMAASSLPPVIAQAIDADIAGEPLDEKAESKARARGWRDDLKPAGPATPRP